VAVSTEATDAIASGCESRNNRAMVEHMIFSRILRDEGGVTAIEYGLISSLVVVAIIAVMQTLGTKVATGLFGLTAAMMP